MSTMERPLVGISQCLLGDHVRYDGGHKRDAALLEAFAPYVEWMPVCPEVEVGMGTPREPIQLVAAPDGVTSRGHRVRLVGVNTARDWTAAMDGWCRERARQIAASGLSGYVLKRDSPSCGLDGVRIEGADRHAQGRGLFAQALLDAVPDLPIEDETELRDPEARSRFLARVLAYERGSCLRSHR